MSLLKEGKTNWKYVLIVLILAITVGGGTLWWVKKPEVPPTELPKIEKPEEPETMIRNLIQKFYEALEDQDGKLLMSYFTPPETPEEKESYEWLTGADLVKEGLAKELVYRIFMKVRISNLQIDEIKEIEKEKFLVTGRDEMRISKAPAYPEEIETISRKVSFIVVEIENKWLVDKYILKDPTKIFRTEKYSGFGYEEIIADLTNWKTYRNEEYGFEIKYPNIFSMKETYISEKPPTGIHLVSEDKNYFKGAIWARVFAKDEQKSKEECIGKEQDLLSYKDQEGIHAIVFYHFVNYPEHIGAYCGMSSGCNYKDIYRSFYNDYCYQIEYSRYDREFIEGNPYDPQHKVIGDVKEIPTLFNEIFSTFRFLE